MGIYKRKKEEMDSKKNAKVSEGRHKQHQIVEGAQFIQVDLKTFNAFGKGRKLKRFEYEHEICFTQDNVEIMFLTTAEPTFYILQSELEK